jgi:hypothetical protein
MELMWNYEWLWDWYPEVIARFEKAHEKELTEANSFPLVRGTDIYDHVCDDESGQLDWYWKGELARKLRRSLARIARAKLGKGDK